MREPNIKHLGCHKKMNKNAISFPLSSFDLWLYGLNRRVFPYSLAAFCTKLRPNGVFKNSRRTAPYCFIGAFFSGISLKHSL